MPPHIFCHRGKNLTLLSYSCCITASQGLLIPDLLTLNLLYEGGCFGRTGYSSILDPESRRACGDEKTGNAVGTILTAFFAPVHPHHRVPVRDDGRRGGPQPRGRGMVLWRRAIPAAAPEEYAGHITQMRACFTVLDGAVGKLNAELEEGSVPLRANRVKADFLR